MASPRDAPAARDSMSTTIHDHLKAAYEDVAYVGRPNPHSHPDRLAAIAALFGLSPPDPSTARVLEVGCGDGANLLPMAARMPGAHFTGCDLSSLLMSRAREMAEGLGLGNVELIEGDLREIAPSLPAFDYIIAHGFYSWVPSDVRDAFLALARTRLAPGGLVCASYNVLPGCYVRQIGWDAIRLENAGAATPRERLEGARRIRREIAQAWNAMGGTAAHLAAEFADDGERSDSAIYHDDLSAVNQPVHFTTFVRHAGANGLGYLAEAELGSMGAGGLPAALQAILAKADPIAREQYLDFARLRRFRQSILVPSSARARITPAALDRLHLTAVTGVVQQRFEGRPTAGDDRVVELLADRYPASVPGAEAVEALAVHGMAANDARNAIVRACFGGGVELHARPLELATRVSARPRSSAVARWQAARSESVTNLRHEGVRIDESAARTLLAAADGSRDRDALAATLGAVPDAAGAAGEILERFALTALLEA